MSIGSEPRAIIYHIRPAKVAPMRTVCEVHRTIYRLIESKIEPDRPEAANQLKQLVAEAYDLSKRMARRLREYNRKAGAEFERDILDHDDD